MEIQQKKNNWLKKIVIFVFICVLLSGLIKVGGNYYLSNYWSPGSEKILLNECMKNSRASVGNEVSDEAIAKYCDCNLQKIKAKYKPKEVSKIDRNELEAIARECRELIK